MELQCVVGQEGATTRSFIIRTEKTVFCTQYPPAIVDVGRGTFSLHPSKAVLYGLWTMDRITVDIGYTVIGYMVKFVV